MFPILHVLSATNIDLIVVNPELEERFRRGELTECIMGWFTLLLKPRMRRNERSMLSNRLMADPLPLCFDVFWVNGILIFLSNYCCLSCYIWTPLLPPPSRYTKLLRTSGKRNKPQRTNKKSFSDCVTLDPGESHFLASKDCLQSLPWYAHVDILRSLDALFFFFLFIFSFFLMLCKSI